MPGTLDLTEAELTERWLRRREQARVGMARLRAERREGALGAPPRERASRPAPRAPRRTRDPVAALESERRRARAAVARRRSPLAWWEAMAPCVLCGFFLTQAHHRWGVLLGDGPDNLVPLCPNHHQMLHRGLLALVPLD